MLFDKIAFVYFIRKYIHILAFGTGNRASCIGALSFHTQTGIKQLGSRRRVSDISLLLGLFRLILFKMTSVKGKGEKSALTHYGIITGRGLVRLRDLIGRGNVL